MGISSSREETNILNLLDLRESGQITEVSSITTLRPSSCGLMRRINSESSLCRRDLISLLFSRDFQSLLPRLKRRLNSPVMITSDTFPPAQPTWELDLEPPFTSTFQ